MSNARIRRVTALRRTRPLTGDLLERIERDPAFNVVTADRQRWICPYDGRAVQIVMGRVRTAREHLVETGLWLRGEPLPLVRIEYFRWMFELPSLLRGEPRMRMFSASGWLNPFNGETITALARPASGTIGLEFMERMARHLAGCPEARDGRMMTTDQLGAKLSTSGAHRVVASNAAQDMARAREVQQRQLRRPVEIPGFEIGLHFAPRSEVSGDFYDQIAMPDGRQLLVLGDVSGHGMQAALVVASAVKTLRLLAREGGDLVALLGRLNTELRTDLVPGQFITLSALLLDPDAAVATLALAGHHPALLVNPAESVVARRVGRCGIALGLVPSEVFMKSLQIEALDLRSGDVLVQYSDGCSEAKDRQDREFGTGRLFAQAIVLAKDSAQTLADSTAQEVRRWAAGTLDDDLTLLVLRLLPDAEEPAQADPPVEATPA